MNTDNIYSFGLINKSDTRSFELDDKIDGEKIIRKNMSLYYAILAMRNSNVYIEYNDNYYQLTEESLEDTMNNIDNGITPKTKVFRIGLNLSDKIFCISDDEEINNAIILTNGKITTIKNTYCQAKKLGNISIENSNVSGVLYRIKNFLFENEEQNEGYYLSFGFELNNFTSQLSTITVFNEDKSYREYAIPNNTQNPTIVVYLGNDKKISNQKEIKISYQSTDGIYEQILNLSDLILLEDSYHKTGTIEFVLNNVGITSQTIKFENLVGNFEIYLGDIKLPYNNNTSFLYTFNSIGLGNRISIIVKGNCIDIIYDIKNTIEIYIKDMENLNRISDNIIGYGNISINKFVCEGNNNISLINFSNNKNLTYCYIEDTYYLTTCLDMFKDCIELKEVYLQNTSNILNMKNMFYGCNSLINISSLDTLNVINMSYMFYGCKSLTTIPLMDTSKVISMYGMFKDCILLTTIPLMDTSKVISMNSMFQNCTSLTTIPLLDTSNVTDMSQMFYGCTSLTNIPLIDTSKVINMKNMFFKCYSLIEINRLDLLNISTFDIGLPYTIVSCKLRNLKADVDFRNNKLLNEESVRYILANVQDVN